MKFKVAYSVSAELLMQVDASSFDEALKEVLAGKGEILDCIPFEKLDGSGISISNEKIEYRYDNNNFLIEVIKIH